MKLRRWCARAALFVALWTVYAVNGRSLDSGDTMPATLLSIALVRGDGPILDRFDGFIRSLIPTGELPYWTAEQHGHLVSRYPILPAFLAAPLAAGEVTWLDRERPGWDAVNQTMLWYARRMAKVAATAEMAICGVLVFELLTALGLRAVLWPTLLVMLGSPIWTVGSQGLWQHGPVALALTTALWLLVRWPRSPLAGVGAGMAAGGIAAARLVDLPLALAIGTTDACRRPRILLPFLLPLVTMVTIVVAYNLAVFDNVWGGQASLERLHGTYHDVAGTWGNPLVGATGTLFSPSRGLFLYCPWTLVTLLMLPATAPLLRRTGVWLPVAIGLTAQAVLVSSYNVWWAGWSFGPRFWTDVMPLFAVLAGFAWHWALARSRLATVALLITGAWAIGIQALGAFSYPSSWNASPVSVDHAHARLWDWRDNEVARMLREGPHPREFSPLPF